MPPEVRRVALDNFVNQVMESLEEQNPVFSRRLINGSDDYRRAFFTISLDVTEYTCNGLADGLNIGGAVWRDLRSGSTGAISTSIIARASVQYFCPSYFELYKAQFEAAGL
jgi:hypothetical protein